MNGCPVCRASFRNSSACPRCDADLAPLMSLAVRAYRLRESARRALMDGEFGAARRRAEEAQSLHDTDAGRALLATAGCLTMLG